MEILIVSSEIEGESVQSPTLSPQKICSQSGDNAGVYAAGEETAYRHIGNHLPFHSIPHQKGSAGHSILIVFLMLPGLEPPVVRSTESLSVKDSELSWLQFLDPFEHAVAAGTGGTNSKNLLKTLPVNLRTDCRVPEERLELGTENEFSVLKGVKQRLYPRPITD